MKNKFHPLLRCNYTAASVRFCLLLLCLWPVMRLHAQERIVTGQVQDMAGRSLPGVTISLKGTSKGAVTDAAGRFTLAVSESPATLVFSFMGYETKEVPLEGNTSINVKLQEDVKKLGELVVVGYGSIKRSDLTGAVASIKAEDLTTAGSSTVQRALQGKVAGVQIESAGGNPGAGARVMIRGVGTLNNNTPLYIVDGVQVTGIDNLAPNDIASIEVLKDASAAAIYGSRAANGVVLVTTKSGTPGKTTIRLNAYYGVQQLAKKLDLLNAAEWARVSNAAHDAAGQARLAIARNPDSLGAGTDWQDDIYRTAPIQSYELFIGGGREGSVYSVSGGYFNQDGIVEVTGYNRVNLRVKSETTKGRFTFGETAILTRERWTDMPGGWGGQGGNPVGFKSRFKKYQNYNQNDETKGKNGANYSSSINERALRFADILLMYAEAVTMQARPAEAYAAVNRIRQRAHLAALPAGYTQEQMMAEIRHQRMIEFCREGLRFYDLRRWGLLEQEIRNSDKVGREFFVLRRHELFPIPQSEMDANPKMEQNPNW